MLNVWKRNPYLQEKRHVTTTTYRPITLLSSLGKAMD